MPVHQIILITPGEAVGGVAANDQSPLSDKGLDQASVLKKILGMKFDLLIHSRTVAAYQTSLAIAEFDVHTHPKADLTDPLTELNWTGTPEQDVPILIVHKGYEALMKLIRESRARSILVVLPTPFLRQIALMIAPFEDHILFRDTILKPCEGFKLKSVNGYPFIARAISLGS